MNLLAFIRRTVCPSVLDPAWRGCEGVMGKLQTHWRCLYELSAMKRRATACFFPRWIKKSSSLSVSLRRIISPKSEQINHLEKRREGLCVRVEHPFMDVLRGLCACLSTRVLCVLQHPCLCVCLFAWLSTWESTEGMKKRMVISVSGGDQAWGSMIKTLNQTPCSNIVAESCNFNFFRPIDTNKLDVTPSNINQPLQETPGCCSRYKQLPLKSCKFLRFSLIF